MDRTVGSVRFALFSPDEARAMSVVEVNQPEPYDEDGNAVDGSVMDRRLGALEPGEKCATCGNTAGRCPGHFGHIELNEPVLHISFVNDIKTFLQSTCASCGRLLLPDEEVAEYGAAVAGAPGHDPWIKERIAKKVAKTALKAPSCPHCGAGVRRIELIKPSVFQEVEDTGGIMRLLPSVVRSRLEKVTDSDAVLLNFDPRAARPEWMVLTVLPVPPPAIRPSLVLESGIRSEDDLTHKLVDIIRINNNVRVIKSGTTPSLIIQDIADLLQYHVTTYFDNEVAQLPPAKQRSGKPLVTLTQRLKGKEGRFRKTLSGKRGDFTARTTLSPGSELAIDEIGIPEEVAKTLTIRESVQPSNVDALREMVLRGPYEHPGANYVTRPDGMRFKLDFVEERRKIADLLSPGYTVERHLMDGDVVLHNRQPSLHRMSILAHRVRVTPTKTFRINPMVCVPGNTQVECDGYTMSIKDLRKKDRAIVTYGRGRLTDIKGFYKMGEKKCLTVVTESGRRLTATSDHPFLTTKGRVLAGDLKTGDDVVVFPSELPKFSHKAGYMYTEGDIMRSMTPHTSKLAILKKLRKRKLSEMRWDDPRAPAIASLVGDLFGDGSLVFEDGGRHVRVNFTGREWEMNAVAHDLRLLSLDPKIYTRRYQGEINSKRGILVVDGVTSTISLGTKWLAILFKSLGVPVGDKPTVDYTIPPWVASAPAYIKHAFVAHYMGAEAAVPKLSTGSDKSFKPIVFKINKIEKHLECGERFIRDIQTLLKEFGVKVASVKMEPSNIRKNGDITVTLITTLAGRTAKNFFGRVGYGYNTAASATARLCYAYLGAKEMEWKKRERLQRRTIRLRKSGKTVSEIANLLSIPEGTVGTWVRRYRIRGSVSASRVSNAFPSFKKWRSSHVFDETGGAISDSIATITSEAKPARVYDLQTASENHTFIAESLAVFNCTPYNSDYDGDATNLFVLQSEEARAEAIELMSVVKNIISPRYGAAIIGAGKDYLSASYLLTKDGTRLTREEFTDMAALAGRTDGLPKPDSSGMYTGKQAFSLFLPRGMNFTFTSSWAKFAGQKNDVVVKDGKLVSGVVDKKAIGPEQPNTLLQRIIQDYGEEEGAKFLSRIGVALTGFITRRSFSYGFGDLAVPPETEKEIERTIEEAYETVDELIASYRQGRLEASRGRTVEETLEDSIESSLSKARQDVGKLVLAEMKSDNPGVIMARTGARGSDLNIGQMAGTVGQQSLRGARIKRGYSGRTLSHFEKGDLSPDVGGFVKSNYKKGLTPTEFFFHAMAGRDSIVDTAMRTQQSGYMQRRLINALQDIKVENDLTARDSGRIIQYEYGEDGVDPAKSDAGRPIDVARAGASLGKGKPEDAADEKYVARVLRESGLNRRLADEVKGASGGLGRKEVRDLVARVQDALYDSTVEPGEDVGTVAAQSLGEPSTQLILRTFHFAGVKERGVGGLARAIEIVDATKSPKTPTMDVHLLPEFDNEEGARRTAAMLVFTSVGSVSAISASPDGQIVVAPNPKMLADRGIAVEDVKAAIEDGVPGASATVDGGKVTVEMAAAGVSAVALARSRISSLRLGGVPKITGVTIVKEKDGWVLQTAGSNLAHVLKLPTVDRGRVYTNSVTEMADVLGVEAARAALVKEMSGVFANAGLEVDARHILLLADAMTQNGFVQSVGRRGLVGQKKSVLARAAFEITVPTIARAAKRGEEDELKGVTESVIVGQQIPVGTGSVDLYEEQL